MKKTKGISNSVVFLGVTAVAVALAVFLTVVIYDYVREKGKADYVGASSVTESDTTSSDPNNPELIEKLGTLTVPEYVTVDMLEIGNARSGDKLINVNNIVVHYTGNPGTSAAQNRNYFAQKETEVCSHFIIGLNGEIIQCVPLDEKSAASNERNIDTISIETCHPKKDGKFNQKTYDSLVKLTAWVCEMTNLEATDVIRHYDITGKDCPKYYVDNPDEWEAFISDVEKTMNN